MKNEELKEKMVKIIINAIWKDAEADYDSTDESEAISIADALIAAGIGDVKDVEAEANRYEMLYKLQNRDMALAERRAHDAEHRAEVAERAFSKLVHEMYEHGIRPMCDEKFFVESRLKDAEKELAEEGKNGTTDYTDR